MFTANYSASILPEKNGRGFHVRFHDLPEALTGGWDLPDALAEASDCLAEAIAGRISRGDEIPLPTRLKRGQYPTSQAVSGSASRPGVPHEIPPGGLQRFD